MSTQREHFCIAILADSYRHHGRFNWRDVIFGFFFHRTFRVVVTLRLCQAMFQRRGLATVLLPGLKAIHKLATHLAGMDLPWRTRIGSGFAITHGWGLVISPEARIGSNVTVFHGVTIGRRDRISNTKERLVGYPTLEDEVWVGPHAIIIGNVKIGRGSRIAGGAFVVDDVPPNSIVVGNPGKIVKSGCIPDVFNHYRGQFHDIPL